MAYKKGEGGRPRGAKNRRTVEFVAVLEKRKFCTASAFLELYEKALTDYEYYSARLRAGLVSPMEDNSHKNLKIAVDILKEIASFAYPKLKSVEQIKTPDEAERPLKDLSDEELDKL